LPRAPTTGFPGSRGSPAASRRARKAATSVLGSERAAIELPGILAEGPGADRLARRPEQLDTAQDRFELALHNLSVANRDLAATFTASFAAKRGGSSVIDLTGNFSRADGRAVTATFPGCPRRSSISQGLDQGGKSNDVRLRLKGDLANFRFSDAGLGIFSVVAKITDADLRYADGLAAGERHFGDLIFEGKGMRVAASKASVLAVQASQRCARAFPILFQRRARGSRGPPPRTDERFPAVIAGSPVTKALDGVTTA